MREAGDKGASVVALKLGEDATVHDSGNDFMDREGPPEVMETVGKAVDPELKARIERESEAVFSSARLWVS